MRELTWIVDPVTGDLVVEGLAAEEARTLVDDLLPAGRDLNCARPLTTALLPSASQAHGPVLRVASLYHGSAVDGPGRRSVVQLQHCKHACSGCYVPQTHSAEGGVLLGVDDVVAALLDPVGEPRDGVSITGGEPCLQPPGLLALLQRLKAHNLHIVVYTGYTLDALVRRADPQIHEALRLTDVLVDGPFVGRLADGAGEWRGSRNQRVIVRPGEKLARVKTSHLN